MPLTEFIAFVYLAERRGELQFRALQAHFRGQPNGASDGGPIQKRGRRAPSNSSRPGLWGSAVEVPFGLVALLLLAKKRCSRRPHTL